MTSELSIILMVATFVATIFCLIKYSNLALEIFTASALICLGFQFVSIDDVLASSVNKGLMTLVVLLLISYVLDKTSLLVKVSRVLLSGSEKVSLFKVFWVSALSSSVLNNTAIVATLIQPIRNSQLQSYSRLLLPLSYASIVGGTVTLIGTSTNLIINSMLLDKTGTGFDFFEFSSIGILVSVAVFIVTFLYKDILPKRAKERSDEQDYMLEAEVLSGSELIGKSIEENSLRNLQGLFLAEVVRGDKLISPVSPSEKLQSQDKLIFSGDVSHISQLKEHKGLEIYSVSEGLLKENLTEVLIKPNSALEGRTLKGVGFRTRFDSAVVAIRREGEALSGKLGEIKLSAGDVLVLATSPDFHKLRNINKNFIILSGYEPKPFITGIKEKLVFGGFFASLGISLAFNINLLTCLVFYLAALVSSRLLTVNEIKRRFPIEIILIVTSALTIAKSLESSGTLGLFSEYLTQFTSVVAPIWALIVVYLATWLLTEVITNNAAAALMFPLAYVVGESMGLDIKPFIYAVVFGASCSFISPYGYQTNLMVFNAGEYKLNEFARIGVPVALAYSAVVLISLNFMYF